MRAGRLPIHPVLFMLALARPRQKFRVGPVGGSSFMRTGLFCTYENPRNDYRSAYAEHTELVEFVEALGYDEVWIAEHHFNATATSPSPFAILAHLAARTSRLRLGSAAVLLPFRDPVLVVEDVATVDILPGGRFDLGVARGGPFPEQNKHFGVGPDEARARTSEAPTLVQRLLTEDEVSFDGTFYKADGVALTPKPLQRPVPTFYATSTTDSIGLAARHGYGLMTAAPAPLARACGSVRLYREAAPGTDRGWCSASSISRRRAPRRSPRPRSSCGRSWGASSGRAAGESPSASRGSPR